MGRKSKGRGRNKGRGRGTTDDDSKVGQAKSTTERPGASANQASTPPQEERPQVSKGQPPQEEQFESICEGLSQTSLDDSEQLPQASKQKSKPRKEKTIEPLNQPRTSPSVPPSAQGSSAPAPSPVQGKAVPAKKPAQSGPLVVASAMSQDRAPHLRQQTQHLPRRPGYGSEGRPIKLKANFFKLDFSGIDYIYHYDINIQPERTPIAECREVVEAAVKKYLKEYFDNCRPAFDGRKNLYCRKMLPSINGQGCELEVTLPGKDGGKDRKFKLTVKYAAQVRVADLNNFLEGKSNSIPEAVQALDIILRQIPSLYFTPVGRSFFPSDKPGDPLGGGCEVRTGFYQSVRHSGWKTMLVNIDVSSKGFIKAQGVIEFLCEIIGTNEGQISDRRWQMKHYDKRRFVEAIRGFKVETCHIPGMKRKYLVHDLGKNAVDYKFSLQDEGATPPRMISVQDYFKEKYKLTLRYPHLPCLVVGQKKNYLPMEVCKMVDSQKRKLTEEQTAAMIKKVTCPACKRKEKISDWADQFEKDARKYLQDEYGMKINKNMVDVDGRVLPAPNVTLGDQSSIVPRDGVWDMRGSKFFNGVSVRSWAMVIFADPHRCGEDVARKFSEQMSKVCRSEGMEMNRNPCDVQYATTNDNIENILGSLVSRYKDLQLVLVVLPFKGNNEVYKEVKRVGDTILGIPTQCVQNKQFSAAKPQVCSNIAMKINAKLGGINHIVDPSMMPPVFQKVIVFGADVTHPSPGENNIPSIAAVVASMDSHASRYAARVRAQTHLKDKSAQEIILGMAEMVKELLVEFYKATQTKPERILFYRDGVSEGQFDQVLLHEVRAVQQACLNIQKDGKYRPKITFVVVQKRHHARLFCAVKKDESGRAGNIPPGTMVDRGITHPFEFDFYLCSHQGIQGTSRPTHYHVLYDDNQFDANSLHKVTYHLCHTYARCTRSVSMPAPAYYAHLVAFRARHHLNGLVTRRSDKPDAMILQEFCDAINVEEKMKKGMYFA